MLHFYKASNGDLEYEVQVNIKDEGGEKKSGKKTVKRRRRPGFRQRSVRVMFGDAKTGKPLTQKVGSKSVNSIQFPITKSVAINEVIQYFETGGGKNLKVVRVIDANSGQGYPVIST